MRRDEIVFDIRDEPEGVTLIIGTYTLQDGRKAGAYERIHGQYFVCPLPGAGYWVKYPQYDQIADKARDLIADRITQLVESDP